MASLAMKAVFDCESATSAMQLWWAGAVLQGNEGDATMAPKQGQQQQNNIKVARAYHMRLATIS